MTVSRWISASLNRKQVSRITAALTWGAGDTYTLRINSVDFIITVGTLVTTTQVATTIFQALTGTAFTDTTASATIPPADGGANLIPQFSEFTATNPSAGVVDLTSNGSGALAGKPFTIAVQGDGTAGNGTGTITAPIAPTSQYHLDEVDNLDSNTTLADGDTLIFDSGSSDVRWGLNTYASGGTCQLAAIKKYKSYTGTVGLPVYNIDNSAKPYPDYRTTYFTTDDNTAITVADLEIGEGPGSGRFKWDAGAGQMTASIYGKGNRLEQGIPCVLLKGSHASNVVRNLAGDLGLAFFGAETAVVATLITGDGPTSPSQTVCGSGCTLTTVTLNGGVQETNSAITTANQNSGIWTHKLGTVTTANIYGGTHYPNGGATYTTLKLFGGTFDASKGSASFVVTNTIQLYRGAKYLDPQGRSGNVVFKLNGCLPSEVTIVIPKDKTLTVS